MKKSRPWSSNLKTEQSYAELLNEKLSNSGGSAKYEKSFKKNVIYSTKNTHAEDRKIEGNLWVCTYMRKNGNKSIKYERGFFVGLLRTI